MFEVCYLVVLQQYYLGTILSLPILAKRKLRHSLGRPSRSDFVQFQFDEKLPAGSYTVMISENVKDYADRNIQKSYTFTEEVKASVTEIRTELPKEIIMGEECTIAVTIITEGVPENYNIEFIPEAKYGLEISEISEIDENGTIYVKVYPKLPGQATINVYVDGVMEEQISLDIMTHSQGEAEEYKVIRIAGSDRNDTSYKVADALKEELGIDKFDTVIVATGQNFADALSGSYLAVMKHAPILLTNGEAANVEKLCAYIAENFNADGMIYILGGEKAVPANVEETLNADYKVERLKGADRYATNLEILKTAGVEEGADLIVATGSGFADSLSASALKKPILLVETKAGAKLTEEQKAVAEKAGRIYIAGGTGVVEKSIENELKKITNVERIAGKDRMETSKLIAERFFTDAETVIVAKAMDFPDGLCGGPLAAAMDAPLLLTKDQVSDMAEDYVQGAGIPSGIVLGGTGALADQTIVDVFALESADEIIRYTNTEVKE